MAVLHFGRKMLHSLMSFHWFYLCKNKTACHSNKSIVSFHVRRSSSSVFLLYTVHISRETVATVFDTRFVYSDCYCDHRLLFFLYSTGMCTFFGYVTGRHGNLVCCQSDALMREWESSKEREKKKRSLHLFIFLLFPFLFRYLFSSYFFFWRSSNNQQGIYIGTSCKT